MSRQSYGTVSPEILTSSNVHPNEVHLLNTKVDVLTTVLSDFNRGLIEQNRKIEDFKNQFDVSNAHINDRVERITSSFNKKLLKLASDFDVKLNSQPTEFETRIDKKFDSLKQEIMNLTTAMEKQTDNIVDKIFPLSASVEKSAMSQSLRLSNSQTYPENDQNESNNRVLSASIALEQNSHQTRSTFEPIEKTCGNNLVTGAPNSGTLITPTTIRAVPNKSPAKNISMSQTKFHEFGNVGYTKPNNFSGKSSWSDYKVHFEIVAQLNGWFNEVRALKLISCMESSALAVLGTLTPTALLLIMS